MKLIIAALRRFFRTMGLVEQSQVVASTAVIVAMATIVAVHLATGTKFSSLEYISLLSVGIFGFLIVYFSLKYIRTLEDQRRELEELNTIGEAVNHSVELDYVLQSALVKVMELMNAECGWIYIIEKEKIILKYRSGTVAELFSPAHLDQGASPGWIREPGLLRVKERNISFSMTEECKSEGLEVLASMPLVREAVFAGVLVIGSKEVRKFEEKKIGLIQAFGNQISVALQNASLFQQIRESERLYADLYDSSPDMYHSLDRSGIVTRCNLTESRVLGYPREKIIGQSVLNLYPVSQQRHVRENLRKIFEHGKDLRGVEEQMQKADGTLADVSVNTSLISDSQGKPLTVRVVLRDITEKKKMEEKILQAQKIDIIGNLAAGLAHDINNILTPILGTASILRRKVKDDPQWARYISNIEDSARRGSTITQSLNTFGRREKPRVHVADVNDIIDRTLLLLQETLPKLISIKCVLAPGPLVVDADEGLVQQALLNLCLNSRDAMPKGGLLSIESGTIILDEEKAAHLLDGKPGSYVLISVKDSGVGIPPAIRNRIFEPFFTTKEPGKGTGLGLSVVYGIVRNHNGYINLEESEVNSGTVFSIYLPQVMDERRLKPERRKQSDPPRGSERILLIEDEIAVGEVGADILRDLGYAVEVVRNGDEVDRQFSPDDLKRFNLVILDMNMPKMGGKATFEYIKRRLPSMKVLICTGYSAAMIDDVEFARAIDGFIQKPYELTDIAEKVRAILDRSGAASGIPQN